MGFLGKCSSLREVKKNGAGLSVYHFSVLPDSPLLVADVKPLAGLSADDFAFAARLGVGSLSVRKQEKGRQILPVLPLTQEFQTALSSRCAVGVLSQEEGKQLKELLNAQPSQDLAFVVSQTLRAGIRELLRFEFPTVPVLGSSEVPKPMLAKGYHTVGKTFHAAKRYQVALEMFLEAASLQPQESIYHYSLGTIYYRLGNLEEARDAFQKAAELNDKYPLAHFNLGNCYYPLGQPDQAIAEWEETIRLDPKFVNALYNLGVALWATGDATGESHQKAVAYWQEALHLDRNLTVAEDNLQAVAQARQPDLAIFDCCGADDER